MIDMLPKKYKMYIDYIGVINMKLQS